MGGTQARGQRRRSVPRMNATPLRWALHALPIARVSEIAPTRDQPSAQKVPGVCGVVGVFPDGVPSRLGDLARWPKRRSERSAGISSSLAHLPSLERSGYADLIANIDVAVFKDGLPFVGLAITMRPREFLHLLSVHDIPRNWLAAIIDGEGRFIARVPNAQVGQLASAGLRATKDRPGLSEYASSKGDSLIAANAQSSLSAWRVEVGVQRQRSRRRFGIRCAGR